jgi:3-deoxy-D-manno-octulosonate 8-phosphate phosphatase (KDO 8-P phosphatase)
MIDTPYGKVTKNIFKRAQNIKLFVCDVDGVFSDGRIYLGNDGEELKAFHTKDGFGLKAIMAQGIEIAIITGRKSNIVENRMLALGIKYIFQGSDDKLTAYKTLLNQLNLKPEQTAYIGDDVVDLPVMNIVGLSIAVNDAHPLVSQQADLVTTTKGGFGAVREVCDLFLQSHGQLSITQGKSE